MKNRPAKIITFILFLILFAALFAWWMFYLPYDVAKLYSAMPADAVMVSSHLNMPARLLDMATNEKAKKILKTRAEALEKAMKSNPNLREAFQNSELKDKETLFAVVPRFGNGPENALVFATWLGGYGQALRWSLLWKKAGGINQLGNYEGYPIWSTDPDEATGQVVSMAIVDGILLGCVSKDPAGVKHVLATYDGHTKSMEAAGARQTILPLIPDNTAPDKGWFSLRRHPSPGQPSVIAFSIKSFSTNHVSAAFQSDMTLDTNSWLMTASDVSGLGLMLGEAPALFFSIPARPVVSAARIVPSAAWATALNLILNSGAVVTSNAPAVLYACTGELGGGIGTPPFRFKIPAAGLALKTGDREKLHGTLNQALDVLNAKYRTGLIVGPAQALPGNIPFYAVEMTSSNTSFLLEREDLPGVAMVGDWTILCSNQQSLKKMIGQWQERTGAGASDTPDWLRAMTASKPAVFLWIDLESGGKAIETVLGLAQAGLVHRMIGGENSDSTADLIVTAKEIIKEARSLGSAVMKVEFVDARPRLTIEAGTLQKK